MKNSSPHIITQKFWHHQPSSPLHNTTYAYLRNTSNNIIYLCTLSSLPSPLSVIHEYFWTMFYVFIDQKIMPTLIGPQSLSGLTVVPCMVAEFFNQARHIQEKTEYWSGPCTESIELSYSNSNRHGSMQVNSYFSFLKFLITLWSASAMASSFPIPVHLYSSQSKLDKGILN